MATNWAFGICLAVEPGRLPNDVENMETNDFKMLNPVMVVLSRSSKRDPIEIWGTVLDLPKSSASSFQVLTLDREGKKSMLTLKATDGITSMNNFSFG
jgi:hypothetical protein